MLVLFTSLEVPRLESFELRLHVVVLPDCLVIRLAAIIFVSPLAALPHSEFALQVLDDLLVLPPLRLQLLPQLAHPFHLLLEAFVQVLVLVGLALQLLVLQLQFLVLEC